MFARLRSFAPAVLALALLSGQAAAGIVLAHVTSEHSPRQSHAELEAAGDHAGHHHAGHHDAATRGGHEHADHGPDHTHQIVPATAASPARIAWPSIVVQACLAVVEQEPVHRPAPGELHRVALPVLGAGPPEPQRHPILLI